MKTDISAIRKDYKKYTLTMESTVDDAVVQFRQWFNEAIKSEVSEVNAMTLSTVTEQNRPSARVVLLKGVEEGKFVFYTNYQSDKGSEMEKNPFVSLTFFWAELERQVRIEGKVERVTVETSTAYFQTRPRESQIGAWASPQSSPIANREILEERVKSLTKKFEGNDEIEKPAQWGGYAVTPNRIEFWQGRASRLHDRVLYVLDENNKWAKMRLAP